MTLPEAIDTDTLHWPLAWAADVRTPHSLRPHLPAPWPLLESRGFNRDLYARVLRFSQIEQRRGRIDHFKEFLGVLGQGYLSLFDASIYTGGENPVCVGAVEHMAAGFGDLIPSILWQTLASLCSRPDAHQEKSILEVVDQLPLPWYIADAALHAMGKSYGLFFYVQSTLSMKAGRVLLHGCGCSHYLPRDFEAMVACFPPIPKETLAREFLDHLIGEVVQIVIDGYPFVLNDEAVQSARMVALRPVG